MDVERLAGILIVAGSLLFIAAASPIGGEVYGETDATRQMEIISANPWGWRFSQVLFGASSLIVAAGFLLYSNNMAQSPQQSLFRLSSLVLMTGAVIWCGHVAWRAFQPQRVLTQYFSFSLEFISFVAVGVLTALALAGLAIAIVQQGNSAWLGYTVLILTAVLTVQMVVFRGGFIPLLFYFPTLIAGIVMLL